MFKNQRIFYWSCFLFLCLSSSLSAQTEICDNGLDDDGDGLIDCYDPDCCGNANCDATFYDPCDIIPTCFEGTIPTTFAIRNDRTSDIDIAPISEISIPFVGDLDNDGTAEYVAANTDGPVFIFEDGAAGLTLIQTLYGGTIANTTWSLPTVVPAPITALGTDPYPAIGDVDADGNAEIVVRQLFQVGLDGNNNPIFHYHLCVYSAGGDLLAFYDLEGANSSFDIRNVVSTLNVNINRTTTSGIYDFDGDGVAEISHGLGIFRYEPAATTGSRLELLAYPTTIEGRGLNNDYYGEQVVAVDIDAAGPYGLELIAGNTVYNVDPTTPTPGTANILGTDWSITTGAIANTVTAGDILYPDGYTSVVDWNGDNLLDVVVSSNRDDSAFVYIWNPRSEVIMAESNALNSDPLAILNTNVSRASVTDFDNDGALEVVVTTAYNFRIFESSTLLNTNGIPTLVESDTITTTDQSGSTTCTAFDFNYDGVKEIVYRDQDSLRIFNYDGAVLTQVATSPCASGTVVEYPVVADVDNDGQAEIVCACIANATTNANKAAITVFESDDFPWADTRSVWNQHAYFYANINDDLSIPTNQQNHALPHNGALFTFPGSINSFLHQHADTVFRLPNAVLSNLTWDCEDNSITVEVCNEGDNTLSIGMPITVYAGNPQTASPTIIGAALLGTNIPPDGSCVIINIPLATTFSLPTAVHVMLNADASTPTPFDLVNYTPPVSTILECDYTDNIGNLTVFPKPTIGINASVPNPVCQNSQVTLTATSSNNSINSLVWDPATVGTTNPVTITPTIIGTQTYTVTVTDNNGCSGTGVIDIVAEECCQIKDDPSYFHLTANPDPALLAQNGLNPPVLVNGELYYILAGGTYHSLPSRVYVDDGIVLEVRGDGASLDLVNSDIVFGQCARLEVSNGAELRAYNTVFRPCNEATSWAGIEFTRTTLSSTLPTGNLRECTFINADVALNIGEYRDRNGLPRQFPSQMISDITIQDNLFSNCRRGIRISNLAPNQAISGNDFQIDNVDNITFHDINCDPITNRDDYMGIQLLSSVNAIELRAEYALNIHQNTFIDATPVATSQSEYTGIQSLTSVAQLEISANDFTNMFQSVRLAVPNTTVGRYTMVENNEINVTRRSILNNVGSSQIVINSDNGPSEDIEIFNNRISCSADAPALDVLINQNAAFMQSAINIDNASATIVRDNVIEGFEVGIYIRQAGVWNERRLKVVDNNIKSNYYGIFLSSELTQPTTGNNLNAFILCNEIEMDLENHTTSVGVAVHFNRDITPSTNHYITGNCIKHTYRAIEIINNTSTSARMPTILNNYLYNYREAGISIGGEFNQSTTTGSNPSIGQGNGDFFDGINGHNTFISNNEDNAFDIFVAPGSTTIDAINNDYGTNGTAVIDNSLNNVNINQTDIQYPSFAKCANQDASLVQEELDNLSGVGRALFFCGQDGMLRQGTVLFRTTTSGSTILTSNYTQSIQDLVADNNGRLLYGLTADAFGHLSNQADKDALYTTVVNTGLLTTNEAAWLSYEYESNQGNYATAKQVVQSIQGETEDENELKVIAIIHMDLSISSRSVQELTNSEIQTLKDIDDRRGVYAADARNIVHVAIGGHPYLFAPYPLSKALNSKSISRSDFTTPSLNIYPNPTNDAINIDFVVTEGSDQVLNIYNATGKLIKSVSTKAMVGQLTVNVADLAQGMYIATLKSENGNVQSGKFVKQ